MKIGSAIPLAGESKKPIEAEVTLLRALGGEAVEIGTYVYPDHADQIPNTAVDGTFIDNLSTLIKRLASPDPARRVPSRLECGFCNITAVDCVVRMEQVTETPAETSDF